MSIATRRLNRAPYNLQDVANAIISDSFGAHDALPKGVPSYMSWYASSDANPNVAYTGYTSYQAVNVWGQVFAVQGGSTNVNVRVQATDPRVWFLRPSGWVRGVEPSGTPYPMGGAYFRVISRSMLPHLLCSVMTAATFTQSRSTD